MNTTIKFLLLSSLVYGCTASSTETERPYGDHGSATVNQEAMSTQQQIITSLTFQKYDAEEAMEFYVSLFDNSRILAIQRWGKEGPGKEGTIMQATFELNGKKFMCSDSPPVHNWDFSPAVSNFVECRDEEEIRSLYAKLSENGEVAMPLDNYGFSQQFAWVMDRFGVSWQLNLQ
jgi:predicted 3-demethylubiquinone-9 3-methyltransferase (glyoxalase superfamily)